MLVFDDIKLIYLANPKTGTTAFESAFRKYANKEMSALLPKHVTYRRLRQLHLGLVRRYEVITCVRDPLETLYSWYCYRSRLPLAGDPKSTAEVNFMQFMEEWCASEPREFAQVHASVRFVQLHNGKVPQRLKLFRYDWSPSISDYVAQKRGRRILARPRNVSPKGDGAELDIVRQSGLMRAEKLVAEYEVFNALQFANAPAP